MKKTFLVVALACVFALSACITTGRPSNGTHTQAPAADNGTQSTTAPNATSAPKPTAIPTSAPTPEPTDNNSGEEAHEMVYAAAEAYKNSIGTVWVQAVVQIKNTGSTPLYVDASSLDIENSDGKLIKTISLCSAYPQIILSGETTLIVEQTTLDDDPGEGELKVIPHYDVKKAKTDSVRLVVSEEELKEGKYGGIKMMGRVENNTNEAQKSIYIVANLYDADDHAIGQLFTILSNELKVGEKVGFELSALSTPDSLTIDSVARFEVFAFKYTYQF